MTGILDSVLLGEEPAETAPTDDNLLMFAGKVLPQAVNVVDDLPEGVGFGAGALAVASKVEGEHAKWPCLWWQVVLLLLLLGKLAVDGKVRPVISCSLGKAGMEGFVRPVR